MSHHASPHGEAVGPKTAVGAGAPGRRPDDRDLRDRGGDSVERCENPLAWLQTDTALTLQESAIESFVEGIPDIVTSGYDRDHNIRGRALP